MPGRIATTVVFVRARNDRAPLFPRVRGIVEAARGVITQQLLRLRLTKGVNFPQYHQHLTIRNLWILDLEAVEGGAHRGSH
jgi:hypothetical protein